MPQYLQTDRPMKVATALGGDKFLLAGIHGHEGLSTPFLFRLDLRSEDAAVDGAALLRTPVSVTITTESDAVPRRIHGLVSRFVQLGRRDDLTAYSMEIVPWFWFLSLSRDCRIFQQMSVLDIVQQVFKDRGFTDYRAACTGSYPPREYCVQYRETDLDFVSRLLEEEGIFYFFEHSEGKHTLTLADANSTVPTCPGTAKTRMGVGDGDTRQDVVLSLSREDAVHTGKVTLKDHDYLKPGLSLQGTISGASSEELYDYPGGFTAVDEGERLARIRLEAEEALHQVVRGESTWRALQAGTRFDLENHYRSDANRGYLIVEAKLTASAQNFRGWDGTGFEYRNEFLAIPTKTPFRPPRLTSRPVVSGSQTALVVGKSGEEIWVDSHGRVKVQFYWDRKGARDEKSSCWVRVSSAWAGKGWGAVNIPRIGQEVVVDFLDGDPDHPIIVGSVYNAEQMPPYALPANQTQSGLRSRSSKGGGGDNFNEVLLEDKKGSERIAVQAEKDLNTVVKNDETREVRHDRTTTIKNNDTRTVAEGNDVHVVEKGDQKVEVKKGNQSIVVAQGGQTTDIKLGDQETTLGNGNQRILLKTGDQELKLDSGNQTVVIKMGDRQIKLSMGNLTTKLDLGKVSYEAMQGIELKVGQSSIKVDPMGVTIKGMKVSVEGQIQTQVKGLMTTIKGDAMLQASGGITMIG